MIAYNQQELRCKISLSLSTAIMKIILFHIEHSLNTENIFSNKQISKRRSCYSDTPAFYAMLDSQGTEYERLSQSSYQGSFIKKIINNKHQKLHTSWGFCNSHQCGTNKAPLSVRANSEPFSSKTPLS